MEEGRSIGTELERLRLRTRAARIRDALAAMRQLASERDDVPAPLRHGMTDFGRELERVEGRLRELERRQPAPPAVGSRAWPRRSPSAPSTPSSSAPGSPA